MASEDEDEYEYEYSDDEEVNDDADYVYDDDDVVMGDTSNHQSSYMSATSLEWNTPGGGNPNAAPTAGAYKSGIRMLPAEELVPEMRRRLKDVTEVLDIPSSAAMVLLRNYNWSKEALLETYYSSDNILQNAGVYFRCNPRTVTNATNNKPCGICYDDMTPETALQMPCGHAFCRLCWRDFCSNAVQEGPTCVQSTTCPQASCNELVTEIEMEACLKKGSTPDSGTNEENLLQKYFTYQLRSFVESNKLTRWCPGKGCEFVASASSQACLETIQDRTTQCHSCNTAFCVVCGEEPHAPCGCKEIALWKDKCRNESETANWILANTKSCPKCVSRIEKNQGCNHMTCGRCSHEFCWICMGDWSNHGANTGGYYKCNKFNAGTSDDGNQDQSEAARAKRELDRYLHYYKRYHAHDEAEKFARKQLKETEARMVLLQESSNDTKWSDVEFLKAANEQLVECRHVLKFTYVYAYYLGATSGMQKERFEYHQEMLERFTENLSELSEKPLAKMDRTEVVNTTRVVNRFMSNILKYVEDGMDDV